MRELCGVRRTDHRAPAATPKKMATRAPTAAAQSNVMRSLRFTARSCDGRVRSMLPSAHRMRSPSLDRAEVWLTGDSARELQRMLEQT